MYNHNGATIGARSVANYPIGSNCCATLPVVLPINIITSSYAILFSIISTLLISHTKYRSIWIMKNVYLSDKICFARLCQSCKGLACHRIYLKKFHVDIVPSTGRFWNCVLSRSRFKTDWTVKKSHIMRLNVGFQWVTQNSI